MPTIQRSIEWHYTPEAWDAFVGVQRMRFARDRRRALSDGAVVFVFLFAVGSFLVWLGGGSGFRNDCVLAVACASVSLVPTCLRVSGFPLQLARLQRTPRVLIGPSSLDVGGIHALWGVSGLTLRRVAILAVDPILLEFRIEGGFAGGYTRYRASVLAPVPIGKESEAKRLTEELGFPWETAAAIPNQQRPRGAGTFPWWRVAAATILLGGFLFFVDSKVEMPGSRSLAPTGGMLVLSAFALWIISAAASVGGIVAAIRAAWRRRRAG